MQQTLEEIPFLTFILVKVLLYKLAFNVTSLWPYYLYTTLKPLSAQNYLNELLIIYLVNL